ncbi:formyltransferase family protein [Flavobacteriaceae bacterium]|nr:formyltransferase family protein [Flavobacteriaceae bacterium]
MINYTICVAGDGWGALAVLKGIIGQFNKIEILTNDKEVIELSSNSIIINNLHDSSADLVICSGYKSIIQKSELLQRKIINIHPSLLPKYRGYHGVVWAILNNESKIGITIHEINEYIDDGPIIKQFVFNNDFKSNSFEIMTYLLQQIENNISSTVEKYLNNEIKTIQQNKEEATYVGKRNYEDCKIPFNKGFDYLANFFRAIVTPYPLPYIRFKMTKREYIVLNYKFHHSNVNTHIGRILNIDNEGLWVKSRDGYVVIKQLVDKEMNDINIFTFKIGQQLEL